uniref:Bromodomain and WD repeat domain containing 1 n=1 Tax=Myotis myotis TaxID=51298 RepID=A0A7J7ZT73_MYOMY|nr:bromodomain and WD repeat domain containing 1 [Myotis myotis]
MAESSPARRPVPLIESELYFLIARYLSAGPCRRAAQVSAGLAGGGPVAAEEAGLGGQRAQQELRGIGLVQ